MNTLFPTLLSKTLFIVCFQLALVTLGAYIMLRYFRCKYQQGVPWITGVKLEDGTIDLQPEPTKIRPLCYTTVFINFILFIILIFVHDATIGNSDSIKDIILPMILFSICAITDGITIGCILILKNEHLAIKATMLTLCAVAITMALTCILGIDFSFLAPLAFICLIILLIVQIFRIFKSISKKSQRCTCIFGVITFIIYLLVDFSIITKNEFIYRDDWGAALSLAIDIYLDIINLFLYILELLGD